MRTNRLVAHRGDNTNHPENSLAGIESALEAGAINIEFDIQMIADGSFIIIHDDNFKRTSESSQSVFKVNTEDLDTISVHEPKRFENKHNPTPVPSLSQVLELTARYPNATFFIELKQHSITEYGLDEVMTSLLSNVSKYQDQCVLISFNDEALMFAKKHSQIRVGFVFDHYIEKNQQIAQQLNPNFLICPYTVIPEILWSGSWKWMVYVINDIETSKPFFERGDLDMIETDDITLFLNALNTL